MKKLFALAAIFALAFTACDNGDTGTETPQPSTNTNLKLKLTSKSVMEFPGEGGQGEITFEFIEEETRSAAPAVVTPKTTVDWIDNFEVKANSITFTVEANEDEERSAFITLSYGKQSVMVGVEQTGIERPDVTFKATHLNGTYWGKFPTTKGFNYLVILGDKSCPHYLGKEYGATEYRFNIYSDVSSAFTKEHCIPVGTYKIDHSSTGNPGTIDGDKDQSYLFNANDADIAYLNATMVVTESGITVDVVLFDGQKHRIEYTGSLYYEGYTEGTFADVYPVSAYTKDITFDVTGGHVDAYYRGDHYGTGCDVWFMQLIEEKYPHYNGIYLILDLIVPKTANGYDNLDIVTGEYPIFSKKPSNCEYTIPNGLLRDDCLQMHAWYLKVEEGQIDMSTAAPLTSGSVKVTKEGQNFLFEIDSEDDCGNKILGTFSGTLSDLHDQSYE